MLTLGVMSNTMLQREGVRVLVKYRLNRNSKGEKKNLKIFFTFSITS